MTHEGRLSGWDIRLECTVCGQRSRANRYEGDPPMGHEPPATVVRHCYNCSDSAREYEDGPSVAVETTHFVDIASDSELDDVRYRGYNQKPKCSI